MAAPTFVSEYESSWASSNALSFSVTVAAGDLLVIYGGVHNGGGLLQTPSGGGLTYTLLQTQVQSSSYCTAMLWYAVAPTSQTFTFSLNKVDTGGNQLLGCNVLRFSGAEIGNSVKATASSGAPSASLSVSADSAVVMFDADWNGRTGGRTYRTASFTELSYFQAGAWMIAGGYYPTMGSAGTKTIGLSAPTSQKYSLVAVEVKGVAADPPGEGSASGTTSWSGSAAGKIITAGVAAGTLLLTGAAVGEAEPQGSASASVSWAGAAVGEAEHHGTTTGTATWTGVAAGARASQGAAAGSTAWSGATSGATVTSGSTSGSVSWFGSASGTAPTLMGRTGEAGDTITWTGTAAGQHQARGAAVGAFTWTGATVGATIHSGSASGTWTLAGAAVGDAPSGQVRDVTIISVANPEAQWYTTAPPPGVWATGDPARIWVTDNPASAWVVDDPSQVHTWTPTNPTATWSTSAASGVWATTDPVA